MTDRDVTAAEPAADPEAARSDIHREHMRGSTLMVLGRLISMALNLAVQVLAVRYLGKSGYGAFAYAVALSALATNVVLLGQDQALGRFLPRFETEGRPGRARGAMVVGFATVFLLGGAIVALVVGLRAIGIDLTSDEQAAAVLVVLIGLSPLVAFDELFQTFFATTAKPTAIFFRRHVVTPGLRLASVLFVMWTGGGARDLAWAYLISGALGVALYIALLVRIVRHHEFYGGSRSVPREYPIRLMWRFGTPVYISQLLTVLHTTMIIVLLEAMKSVEQVASFRAVLPIAQMNTIGIQSFRLLYLPVVSRLLATDDSGGVGKLYWQSASWLAVGTFPIFVATFAFAEPVTQLLFGEDFADSSGILAVLALGFYVSSTLGLNTHTLRASGVVRLLLLIDGAAATLAIGSALVLIDRYGAFGAAIASSGAIVVQNVLTHVALQRTLDDMSFPRELRRTYASVAVGAGVLTGVQLLLDPPLLIGGGLGVVVTVGVLLLNRRVLDIGDVVPEIRKVPFLRALVS